MALTVLPDGTPLLVSGSRDTTIGVWNPVTGQQLDALPGLSDPILAMALVVPPDGTPLLAAGSYNGTVSIWKPTTGEYLHTITGHTDPAESVTLTVLPDGTPLLATCSGDPGVAIWNARTGEHLHTIAGHTSQTWSLAPAVLSDGDRFVQHPRIDQLRPVRRLRRGGTVAVVVHNRRLRRASTRGKGGTTLRRGQVSLPVLWPYHHLNHLPGKARSQQLRLPQTRPEPVLTQTIQQLPAAVA